MTSRLQLAYNMRTDPCADSFPIPPLLSPPYLQGLKEGYFGDPLDLKKEYAMRTMEQDS